MYRKNFVIELKRNFAAFSRYRRAQQDNQGKRDFGQNKPYTTNKPDDEAPNSGDERMGNWEWEVTGRHIKQSPSPPPKSQPTSYGKRKMWVQDTNEPRTMTLSEIKNLIHTVPAPYKDVLVMK